MDTNHICTHIYIFLMFMATLSKYLSLNGYLHIYHVGTFHYYYRSILSLLQVMNQIPGTTFLGGGSRTNMLLKLDHFSMDRGENQKSLKPHPSFHKF